MDTREQVDEDWLALSRSHDSVAQVTSLPLLPKLGPWQISTKSVN